MGYADVACVNILVDGSSRLMQYSRALIFPYVGVIHIYTRALIPRKPT